MAEIPAAARILTGTTEPFIVRPRRAELLDQSSERSHMEILGPVPDT
jgi:hypothetical protein